MSSPPASHRGISGPRHHDCRDGAMDTSSRTIRRTTTAVVVMVAAAAAVISYRHAYEVVRAHGETGWTAGLVPLSIDGLIAAASMVILDAARQRTRVPPLARWLLALGILATLAANVAHGIAYGVTGALVAGWPAVALVGSYELLMRLVRANAVARTEPADDDDAHQATLPVARTLEEAVRAAYTASLSDPHGPVSQRALARHFEIDRRRVAQVLETVAQSPNGQRPQEPAEAPA